MTIYNKLKPLIAALVLIIMMPVSSFAIAEFGAYGGYSTNIIETKLGTADMSGYHFGVIAHLTWSLPLLATFGVGAYYQQSFLTYTLNLNEGETYRYTVGLDIFARLDVPVFPLKPYVRISSVAYDKFSDIDQAPRYFNDYSFGGGLAYLLPFEVIGIYIFVEYTHTLYDVMSGDITRGHTGNLGIKAAL